MQATGPSTTPRTASGPRIAAQRDKTAATRVEALHLTCFAGPDYRVTAPDGPMPVIGITYLCFSAAEQAAYGIT